MKKMLALVMVVMLLASVCYGAVIATKVSGSTVSFSTIDAANNRYGSVVTFNSVTNHIRLVNLSTVADCYVDVECKDGDGKTGYLTKNSTTVFVPAIGKATPNTVEIDFSTRNLGFVGKTIDTSADGSVDGSNQKIVYVATGDVGDL